MISGGEYNSIDDGHPGLALILTKIRVPATRPRIVSRTRLVEQLTPWAGTNLILVCAPAGYGKTTLLAEWSQTLLQNESRRRLVCTGFGR